MCGSKVRGQAVLAYKMMCLMNCLNIVVIGFLECLGMCDKCPSRVQSKFGFSADVVGVKFEHQFCVMC